MAKDNRKENRENPGAERQQVFIWLQEICPHKPRADDIGKHSEDEQGDGAVDTRGWKSRLARSLTVAPSTVTWMLGWRTGKDVGVKLARLTGEQAAVIFGLVREEGGIPVTCEDRVKNLALALLNATSRETLLDACLQANLRIEEGFLTEARQRKAATDAAARSKPFHHYRPPSAGRSGHVPLAPEESQFLEKLLQKLRQRTGQRFVQVLAKPDTGANYLVGEIATLPAVADDLPGGVYHLHAGEVAQRAISGLLMEHIRPFDDQPRLGHATDDASRLAQILSLNKALLVISGVDSVDGEGVRFIERLIGALSRLAADTSPTPMTRLVLIGHHHPRFRHIDNRGERNIPLVPQMQPDDVLPYFDAVFAYYSQLRESVDLRDLDRVPPARDSAWLKRVRHHYHASLRATELPSAIRFRACLAAFSNRAGPNPFDPTRGIDILIPPALEEYVPEIAACIRDVRNDLRSYLLPGRAIDLNTLRLISTSLFFFSPAMLDNITRVLQRAADAIVAVEPDTAGRMRGYTRGIHLESKRMREDYVRYESVGSQPEVATMPLLVRACVQSDWIEQDSRSRMWVHGAIHETLLAHANSGRYEDLAGELPYAAPWGYEPAPLALEAIRHAMRASKSAVDAKDGASALRYARAAQATYVKYFDPFAFAPLARPSGPDAGGVAPGRRRISRHHGLFGLKHEILLLLSADGLGHNAPPGLETDYVAQAAFFRELGISLNALLRPGEARTSFEAALEFPIPPEERAYILNHEVSTHITRGDFDSAESLLDQAAALETPDLGRPVLEAMRKRRDARAAALLLARGHPEQSAEAWARLGGSDPAAYRGERAIGYIDALIASDAARDAHPTLAWTLIEHASKESKKHGPTFDTVRIDMRRAALARLMGYPAAGEFILEQVGLELAQWGGSEQGLRYFQFLCCKVLLDLGRPAYGLAAYGLPAHRHLQGSHARPWIDRARKLCLRLLDEVPSFPDERLPPRENHRYWQESQNTVTLGDPFHGVEILPPWETVAREFEELRDPDKRKTLRDRIVGPSIPDEIIFSQARIAETIT